MITKEMIIKELMNRGYDAKLVNTIKNGITLTGIAIKYNKSTCSPVIYIDQILEETHSIDDVLTYIENALQENKDISFDCATLKDRSYVFSNLRIGIQKESTRDIVKKTCELDGLEQYLYLNVIINSQNSSQISGRIILQKKHLDYAGVTEEEAWKFAEENLHNESIVRDLSEMFGYLEESPIKMFCITNKSKTYGASSILDKELIRKLSKKCGTDSFFVLPSSIHEMLLIPDLDDGVDIDSLIEIVKYVNSSEVDEIDRLADTAYKISVVA